MSYGQSARSLSISRWARRPLLLFLVAALVLLVLSLAERGGGMSSTDIANRRAPFGAQGFQDLFTTPAAPAASAVQLPSRTVEQPATVIPQAPALPAVTSAATPAQAMTAAQTAATGAVQQVQSALAAATAAQHFPPFVSAIVCPILLQARAQVIATINALIAAFPALTAQLEGVKASALATIDAQLAQFHCPPIS